MADEIKKDNPVIPQPAAPASVQQSIPAPVPEAPVPPAPIKVGTPVIQPPAPAPPPPYTRLTPMAGVRLAWAFSGGFRKPDVLVENKDSEKMTTQDFDTRDPVFVNANNAEKMLGCPSDIGRTTDLVEIKYLQESTAAIRATIRNLATIYRGRELNFRENDLLRNVYLTSIEEDLTFGTSIKDYARALPGAVLAGGGGVAFSFLSMQYLKVPLSTFDILVFSIIAAVFGLILYIGILKITRWRQKKLFILKDYERNVFYEHYLNRAKNELKILYQELVRIHNEKFDPKIDQNLQNGNLEIDQMLSSLYPTSCAEVDRCIYRMWYDPRSWVVCETRGNYGRRDTCTTVKADKCDVKHEMEKRFSRNAEIGLLAFLIFLIAVISVANVMFAPVPAGVTLTKTLDPPGNYGNNTLSVSVILQNAGRSTLSDIFIEDMVPPEFNYTGGNLAISVPLLGPRESVSLHYRMRPRYDGNFLLPPATAAFMNEGGTCESMVSNELIYDSLTSGPSTPGVRISKSVSPAVLGENQTLVVSVTVENTGNESIPGITLSDSAPDDFVFIRGEILKDIPLLKAAESRSIGYTLQSVNAGNFILNPATVQYSKTSDGVTVIESNSPVIQVVSGFNRTAISDVCASKQASSNTTEIFEELQKINAVLPSNKTTP